MACELMNRICYTMELDEKYASVILRRYVESKGSGDDVYCLREIEVPTADPENPDEIVYVKETKRYSYSDLVIELDGNP